VIVVIRQNEWVRYTYFQSKERIVVKKWFSKYKVVTMFTILSTLLLVSVAINVTAASSLIEIKANLNNGIKIMLHGKAFEPVDPVDGTKYVPITYKGRTYLPLRAVAEGAGLKVTWDDKTKTAYLGSAEGEIKNDQISYINASPEYGGYGPRYRLKSRTPELLKAGNVTFDYGYFGDNQSSQSESFNTNFEYDKFKVRIWADDYKDDDGNYSTYNPSIEFTDENGITIKKLDIEFGKMYELEIDIKDVKELYVSVSGGLSIIGEPKLGK